MSKQFENYNVKCSFSQISSWHGVRTNPLSIDTITYQRSKSGPDQAFSGVELRAFSMPNVIPNIMDWSEFNSLQNNIFSWIDNGNPYSVEIPSSMYDGCSLSAELEILMNAATAPGTYTVEYDTVGGIFQFTTTSGGILAFTPDATWPYYELGFSLGVGVTGAPSITSTSVANLQGSSHIFIVMPDLQKAESIKYNCSDITFTVPLNVANSFIQDYSYLYSPGTKWYFQARETTLNNTYTIKLLFERVGILYPLIMDQNSSYTINFLFLGLQI
jgi:hypothetical protein